MLTSSGRLRFALGPKHDVLENAFYLGHVAAATYTGVFGTDSDRIHPEQYPFYDQLQLLDPEVFEYLPLDAHGYIAEAAEHIVVAFRGSVSIQNWITNVRFEQRPVIIDNIPMGMIHAGFAEAFAPLCMPLRKALEEKLHTPKLLYITGHSLGGAMAILAAKWLQLIGLTVHGLVTFGSPRVGDAYFAASYPITCERWVNYQDPVVHVPPPILFGQKYRHIGRMHYFDAAGKVNSEPSVWTQMRDQFSGLFTRNGLSTAQLTQSISQRLADHDINSYLQKLERHFPT